jgi:putative membrane protein
MKKPRFYTQTALPLASALILAITPMCAQAAGNTAAVSPPVDVPGAVSTSKPMLNDAQIAKIVRTANDGEIQQGKLAVNQTTNSEVRKFARMMIRQHAKVNRKLGRVSKSQNIEPQDSQPATNLKQEGEKTLTSLKAAKGMEFDRAYVDAQVKAHQEVLSSIDKELLPNAKDAKLQAMLKETRPAVEQHLNHATHLQAKLWGQTAPKAATDQG